MDGVDFSPRRNRRRIKSSGSLGAANVRWVSRVFWWRGNQPIATSDEFPYCICHLGYFSVAIRISRSICAVYTACEGLARCDVFLSHDEDVAYSGGAIALVSIF